MGEVKNFLTKVMNSFTPNMPLKLENYEILDDQYILFVKLYSGHHVPKWKNERLINLQEKIEDYTLKKTIICASKKDFEKIKSKYGLNSHKTDEEDELF